MKGDFSRVTFDPARHVHGVLMQQGRVQLDADWNELQAVQSHRAETESVDVVGPNGTPKLGDGFRITLAGADQLTVGKGRMYVDGQLVENDRDVLLTAQPDLPGYQLPTVPGRYVAFLDQRLRELTARDDGSIREVALGGPDTAIRERRVWQVKLLRVGDHDPTATCASTGDVVALHPADRGTLRARAETGSAGSRPCIVAPDAAFRGVENQLYRVEIHRGGDATTATFVWSRDNGCVAADWLTGNVGVNRIRVGGFGRDGLPGFRPNQWVELLDDTNVLFDNTTPPRHDAVDPTGRPGELVQLQDVLDDVLVLAGAPPARGELHPTVRGWDVTDGAIAISATTTDDGYFELESGVQVAFDQAATYTAGDYWLIPARTIIATIEWPKHAGGPAAKPPDGIRPHYAPLALLTTADGAAWTVLDDCRARFPALTAITAEDVEFDNKNCALPGADNVQEALDALCARTDLKKHNKHLHGWGVVDGLQVECCTDNTPAGSVTVRRGYAIDSEGNDRDLAANEIFDVSGAAVAARLLDRSGGADLDLWFDSGDPRPVFKVGQHVPRQDTAREIFDGTIWVDFIKRVVERLQDFVKSEFTVPEGGEKEPVGPIQKRVTTVSNLIVQLLNPTSGAGVFISLTEHQILLKLYSGLKALLSSPTFCGMWDNARPFPDYPFTDKNMETIFTKGLHHRLRVHPGGKVGCSVGMDHRIHLFDLTTSTMVAVLDHPAGIGLRVTDVAFTKDGSALYATAVLGSDTIFATADIALPTANWRPHSIICGVQLVTLATAFDVSDFVYAVSTGQGLYAVNPVNVESHPTPAIAFAATGAFSVAENTGIAYAVSKTGSDFAVMGLQLATNSNLTSLPLPGVDRVHDLLAVTEPGDQLGVLLAATNTPGQSGSSVAFAAAGQRSA